MIDVVALGYLPDAWQAVAGTHFSHVQGREQLHKRLLKETIFMFFVKQKLQKAFSRSALFAERIKTSR